MNKNTKNAIRLLEVVALFAACNGVGTEPGTDVGDEVLSFDESVQLLESIEAEDAAAEEDDSVEKVAGRNGCPDDMTLAASRVQGTSTPETPLYCRLRACKPMGTRAIKNTTICFGPPPPFQICVTGVAWEYVAANRTASSIMCSNEIQAKFGL